ncbi:MAG: hypothetical protein EBU84_19535, partial [Actinobacteria bacterium]|nr:hypothetical protein [Actinomycetota bacterium]
VIKATKSLVKKAFGKGEVGDIPILYEVKATAITPEGETIEVAFSDSLGQRKEQKSTTELYQGFIEKRLYAGIAEQLSERGLVSRGSAKRVGSLPENRGKPMKKWTRRGKPWVKRTYSVTRVAKIEVLPRLVRVTSK